MKNNSHLQSNPLNLHIDVLAKIRQHYTKKEYSYIKKLIECINTNNIVSKDNTPIDSSDLIMLLGISKRSTTVLLNKLLADDMIKLHIRRINNKIVEMVEVNISLAFKDNYSGSMPFPDISKGLDPIDLKTLPKLKLRKFKR